MENDQIQLRLYGRTYSPETAREPIPPPVCTRSELCEGCPYPSNGFVCWGLNGECMRSRITKINGGDEHANCTGEP